MANDKHKTAVELLKELEDLRDGFKLSAEKHQREGAADLARAAGVDIAIIHLGQWINAK